MKCTVNWFHFHNLHVPGLSEMPFIYEIWLGGGVPIDIHCTTYTRFYFTLSTSPRTLCLHLKNLLATSLLGAVIIGNSKYNIGM